MKSNRPLKELYEILLQHFVENKLLRRGICGSVNQLYFSEKISRQEYIALDLDFESRAPKWYNSKFWWGKCFVSDDPRTYWWERTEEGWNCRVEFIKHIINKLSK